MIKDLWLIGIGTGSLKHVTLEGMEAIGKASMILVPDKGPGKEDLAALRRQIIEQAGFDGRIVRFDYPVRDTAHPYLERVERWHDEIARCWQNAVGNAGADGPVALLVWGDPSLYDSTIRIAERLNPQPRVRVVPGITALQALTAAHGIPLNEVAGSVQIMTGRRLRESGWPEGAETVAVMLDGEASFTRLRKPDLYIWWGAYLGSPDEMILKGKIVDVGSEIVRIRQEARSAHGWMMDTYIIKKDASLQTIGSQDAR